MIEISYLADYSMDLFFIYRLIHHLIETTIRHRNLESALGTGDPGFGPRDPRAFENPMTNCCFNQMMNQTVNEGQIH